MVAATYKPKTTQTAADAFQLSHSGCSLQTQNHANRRRRVSTFAWWLQPPNPKPCKPPQTRFSFRMVAAGGRRRQAAEAKSMVNTLMPAAGGGWRRQAAAGGTSKVNGKHPDASSRRRQAAAGGRGKVNGKHLDASSRRRMAAAGGGRRQKQSQW
jgi:hypothetical protein